jgi:CheY-like chemotaxis protein
MMGSLRVLLVEDALDQALLVRSFLQPATAFTVTHAQDGDQAARLLRERDWDLLIADLNLPGLDGVEVCRIARSVRPGLPILVITGLTSTGLHQAAFRAGATDLLTKPLVADAFLEKVHELTGAAGSEARPAVLAVGGIVGDVEMGCGGTLRKHADEGTEVTIVPLCRDELDGAGAGLHAARRAAMLLGAQILIEESALDDTERRVTLLEELVEKLRPRVVLLPAMDEDHPARREAFRVTKACTGTVPILMGYQTATTGHDFRPNRFEDVGLQLPVKMEALSAYRAAGLYRPDLSPRMAQAYARYWGRFERFGEVEAFEVVRGS